MFTNWPAKKTGPFGLEMHHIFACSAQVLFEMKDAWMSIA